VEKKNQYSQYELAPYLDENNALTVRYVLDPEEESYYEVFLPALSVVGRELR